MRRYRSKNSRPAVSELIGAVLTIAMTLIAGAAVWGFARGQAGASEGALQSGAANTNNMLSEHFGIVDMYFSSTTASGGGCSGSGNCSAIFWAYNTGTLTFQALSVRLFDNAGLVNVLFNYTQSGGVKTNQVYDLRSASSTKCKTAASTYETPSTTGLTGTTVKTTNAQLYTLTLPSTGGSCPSFVANPFTAGHTYTVVVTGIYGNTVTYSQTK